jgi:hypothetical protein
LLIFGPWARIEVFFNARRGFHRNDLRGAMATVHCPHGRRLPAARQAKYLAQPSNANLHGLPAVGAVHAGLHGGRDDLVVAGAPYMHLRVPLKKLKDVKDGDTLILHLALTKADKK